ncbi:thermonuclease family protein [Geochorda subterranea]|uniref:Thermonuclease family protein n=1 Tax=Geochorda subterranea TaxID=3109564 RepID=A0ABZ1BLV0_9FIRM|nr:thermonuclease family protein [Limnochorda sp. LNt]WRP13795.1 thermonuclease family protein [Limnochorda sp. LNt]
MKKEEVGTLATTVWVSEVTDGDTFRANGRYFRLVDVDCPELHQPGGQAAKERLSALVLHKYVEYESRGTDSYGRVLAQVWVNTTDVNAEMRRFCGGT